ncbi:MAG: hypothetical protein ACRDK2_17315 [Solirubrobacteraceae bacterium]
MPAKSDAPTLSNSRATSRKLATLAAVLVICVCLAIAAVALATQTLQVNAHFSPDKLGAPTNLSLTAKFVSSTAGPPSPVTKFILYAPAGMEIDTRGAGTCTAATLEQRGPSGCPTSSRAGFGGGIGVLQLPTETIHAQYTLDLFFAPKESGRLRLLVYVSVVKPAGVELVLVAKQIPASKPYGLGFSVEVPPVSTFPGAADASVESAFVTLGGSNVAYFKTVHGKRKLVSLRGIIVPKTCPAGGFPTEGTVDFADGSTLTVHPTIPCP